MESAVSGADRLNGYQVETLNKIMDLFGRGIHFSTHVDDRGFAQTSVVTDSGVPLLKLHIGRSGHVESREACITASELETVFIHWRRINHGNCNK